MDTTMTIQPLKARPKVYFSFRPKKNIPIMGKKLQSLSIKQQFRQQKKVRQVDLTDGIQYLSCVKITSSLHKPVGSQKFYLNHFNNNSFGINQLRHSKSKESQLEINWSSFPNFKLKQLKLWNVRNISRMNCLLASYDEEAEENIFSNQTLIMFTFQMSRFTKLRALKLFLFTADHLITDKSIIILLKAISKLKYIEQLQLSLFKLKLKESIGNELKDTLLSLPKLADFSIEYDVMLEKVMKIFVENIYLLVEKCENLTSFSIIGPSTESEFHQRCFTEVSQITRLKKLQVLLKTSVGISNLDSILELKNLLQLEEIKLKVNVFQSSEFIFKFFKLYSQHQNLKKMDVEFLIKAQSDINLQSISSLPQTIESLNLRLSPINSVNCNYTFIFEQILESASKLNNLKELSLHFEDGYFYKNTNCCKLGELKNLQKLSLSFQLFENEICAFILSSLIDNLRKLIKVDDLNIEIFGKILFDNYSIIDLANLIENRKETLTKFKLKIRNSTTFTRKDMLNQKGFIKLSESLQKCKKLADLKVSLFSLGLDQKLQNHFEFFNMKDCLSL